MTAETVTDAEIVEPGAEIALASTAPTVAVTTPVKASDLVERLGTIREALDLAMQKDVDYGVIPGTQKPTLLKPGAEKLAVLFQLDVQTTHDERWGPGDHLTVPARSIVFHSPTGARLGSGEGMCSTRERKYAYRKQERTCPGCGEAAIIKGKQEYGGGWLCWNKRGGCGAKFPDGSQEIEGQATEDIDNPDLPDLWNTVVKMARKRALVDAVLLVTGASALFTQDVEDLPAPEIAQPPASAQPIRTPAPEPANGAARVTSPPAQATHRIASAKQRGLINGKAGEKGLPPIDLAQIVLTATESEIREFDSQSDAEDWLRRALDRLPARAVDAVLTGIEKAEVVV